MAKNSGNKLKILYLLRILEQNTDEDNPMSVLELIAALDQYGITSARKSIYDDIELLQQYGYDIVVEKGRNNQYYLAQRTFQLPELRLLVDAVLSSRFITTKKSDQLIQKIGNLSSHWQSKQLRQQAQIHGRAKTENESIYYNVDTLHAAILQNSQIRFRYFQWEIDSSARHLFIKKWKHEGQYYISSPWSMLWDDENYYLLAFDEEAEKIKHYRIDKMSDIEILNTPRLGQNVFDAVDIPNYSSKIFGMFGGEDTSIRLRLNNRLIGVAIDRFGENIMIRQLDDDNFTLTISAVISPQFMAWLLGFGNEAEVLAPPHVRKLVQDHLKKTSALY